MNKSCIKNELVKLAGWGDKRSNDWILHTQKKRGIQWFHEQLDPKPPKDVVDDQVL